MPSKIDLILRSARRARLEGRTARLQFFGFTFEEGGEEAVGAVCGRGQAEVVAAGGAIAADRFLPGARGRVQREIIMRSEKTLGLRLVLLAQQRAGGVDQPAARFYQTRGAGEDVALALDELGQVVRRGAPFAVGVAPPAADSEARRIDKDAVEALRVMLDPGVALGRERAALDIAD